MKYKFVSVVIFNIRVIKVESSAIKNDLPTNCTNTCRHINALVYFTPPNSEIICGQNVGTKVVCVMILFFEKKAMLKI